MAFTVSGGSVVTSQSDGIAASSRIRPGVGTVVQRVPIDPANLRPRAAVSAISRRPAVARSRLSYGSTAVAVRVTGARVAAKGRPQGASRQEGHPVEETAMSPAVVVTGGAARCA